MKLKKIFKSKSLLLLSVMIILITLSGTIAYFINDFNVVDNINTRAYNINLTQTNQGSWGEKHVTLSNDEENDSPVIIRLSYTEFFDYVKEPEAPILSEPIIINPDFPFDEDDEDDEDDDTVIDSYDYIDENGIRIRKRFTLSNKINGVDVATKNWTDEFLNDFVDGNDGWFYYKKVLNAQEFIPILESVNLNEELIENNEYYYYYTTYAYYLLFDFEAVTPDSDKIQALWGKTATIDGNNVTWSL